jgi:hypothetical protein
MRPVHHGPDVPTPTPPTTLSESETSAPSDAADDNDVNFPSTEEDKNPQQFSQFELNDSVRDLSLTKEKSE